MKKIRVIIGRILYGVIGTHMPVAHCFIKPVGWIAKMIRQISGQLILCKCGKNVNIYPKAKFSSQVELGDNSDIGLYARLNGKVVIGNDVIIGPELLVYTQNHNISKTDLAIKYQGVTEQEPVYIGDGCWICARAIILPGVRIGKGVVVAAGAVVTKDVPDYSVVAGNPARIVKRRESED